MPTSLSLDDQHTLQAIGILADVLDRIAGPTVLDTVLVSKALRQALATRSLPALDFASRAFATLDPEIKRRIADSAQETARETTGTRERLAQLLAGAPAPAPSRKLVGLSQPTGFLAALNARGRRPKPPPEGGEKP